MPFVYVGRKHSFVGHSVWQIVSKLPDYGKGRLIYRHMFMRYLEPSVMRIVEAKPEMDKNNSKGSLIVENWFRGHYLGLLDLSKPAYKPDFRLVPKHQEHWWLDALKEYKPPQKKIIPDTIAMPPLMRLHLEQQEGGDFSRIPISVRLGDNIHTKLPEGDEKPNVSTNEIDGIGTTDFPYLYEGIDFTQATYPPDPNSYKGPVIPRPSHPRDNPDPKCSVYLRILKDMELESEGVK